MYFQKLIGLVTKSQDDRLFEAIVGHDHIKRLFRLALQSELMTHILLAGPPALAKTMFLTSLLRSLKNAYFIDGGNTTKSGVIDYLFENRPRYLLIDEADKLAPKHQTFLLNLMETGIISETKCGKTRETKIETSVFTTCNDARKLSSPLLSRFFRVNLESYTYEQFCEITLRLLNTRSKIAPLIAAEIWNRSRDIRDCVRIGKVAQSDEEVRFLIDNFLRNKRDWRFE